MEEALKKKKIPKVNLDDYKTKPNGEEEELEEISDNEESDQILDAPKSGLLGMISFKKSQITIFGKLFFIKKN